MKVMCYMAGAEGGKKHNKISKTGAHALNLNEVV